MYQHSHYRDPEGEEREKGPEKIFEEIIAENFPNIRSKMANQVWEAWRVPGSINSRRNTLRHVVINSNRKKKTNNKKRIPINLSADFSKETL